MESRAEAVAAGSGITRPESVTVIGWLLVVFGAFGLLGCLFSWSVQDSPVIQQSMYMYHFPLSYRTMLLVGLAGGVVHMLCGGALLRRMGWARHVFAVWMVPATVYGIWIAPWKLFAVPSILLAVAAVVFLYRPAANRWFAGDAAQSSGG